VILHRITDCNESIRFLVNPRILSLARAPSARTTSPVSSWELFQVRSASVETRQLRPALSAAATSSVGSSSSARKPQGSRRSYARTGMGGLPGSGALCITYGFAEHHKHRVCGQILRVSAHIHERARDHRGQSLPAVWRVLRHVSSFLLLGGSLATRAAGLTDRKDQSLACLHGRYRAVGTALSRTRRRHRAGGVLPRLSSTALALPRAATR